MSPFADALRLALSAAIRTSADARACCERLAGRTMAVETVGQRWRLRFEPGAVAVEAENDDAGADDPADVTVRGSLPALLRALASKQGAEAVDVDGDSAMFEDFRTAFRPHLQLPATARHFAEDAGDAVRVGTKAARSAMDGMGRAVRDKAQDYFAPGRETAAELAALRDRVAALEARLAALEGAQKAEIETAT